MNELPEGLRRHGWNEDSLAFALRDGCQCTYCGCGFLDDFDRYRLWDVDHILPKSKYPELIAEPLNLVSACRVCNLVKGRYDPNADGEQLLRDGQQLTETLRAQFIARTRSRIEEVRATKQAQLAEMRVLIEKCALAPASADANGESE